MERALKIPTMSIENNNTSINECTYLGMLMVCDGISKIKKN